MLTIEIVYCTKNKEILLSLELEPGSMVSDALKISNILIDYPEIFEREGFCNPHPAKEELPLVAEKSNHASLQFLEGRVGIFGKIVPLNSLLKTGDRIEIYRALYEDPKEARRRRGTHETKHIKKEKRDAKALRRAIKRSYRKREDR